MFNFDDFGTALVRDDNKRTVYTFEHEFAERRFAKKYIVAYLPKVS